MLFVRNKWALVSRGCPKVVLQHIACNIVHHFECDEQHGFRFVVLLKIVLKFFLSGGMVY